MKHWQIICFVLLLLLTSCSGNKIVKATNGEKGGIPMHTEGSSPSPFILGSSDEITINVWRNDELKRIVKIDPSGNIYVPLAGEIKASGLTISQLRKVIALRLSKYLVDPQVDITLLTISSQKVHILGEVKSPGTFTLDQRMLAWEAISMAGGFTNDANKTSVLLARNNNGVAKVTALDVHNMLKTGKIDKNIYLKSGDVIYVPPSFIANLERFMLRFNNIISPFVTLERGIILEPQAVDVLRGKEKETRVIVSP